MAERRMFSKKIINSAKFIKMPNETQSLYFHLGINADDDGIVEAYTIMRLIGATEDSLKILSAKGFVRVLNDDLVTHLTDWGEHNLIRADRKVDSIYKDLLLEIVPDVRLIEPKKRTDNENRNREYKDSKLPDRFMGTIRYLFNREPCPVCNVTMVQDTNTKPSVQHNIPLSKNGKHEINNISVICLSCNMSIKDNITDDLNNKEVISKWNNYEDSKRTAKGQHRIGKDRVGEVSIVKDNKEQLFDLFWKAYPKKSSKQKAKEAFMKPKNFNAMPPIEEVINKIDLLNVTDQWRKDGGKFIPHPATWLNAHGWEDEVKLTDNERRAYIQDNSDMSASDIRDQMIGVSHD